MIYSQIIKSKTDSDVPLFFSGKPSSSKYNPEKEAELFAENISASDFFIVSGLCGGFHIKAMREKFRESKILVIEKDETSINFLKENCRTVRELFYDKNLIFTSVKDTKIALLQNYLPVLYRNISLIEYRPWVNENTDTASEIKNAVKEALDEISIDYGTQSRFGKIWQHNILKNLKNCKPFVLEKTDTEKTAAIIASGPSLDSKINYLKQNRSTLYIISTDTAFSSLLKHQIIPDEVLSIDGQVISHSHFMHKIPSSVRFVFDLCGNPSSIRKILKNGNEILFSTSSHPLAVYAEKIQGKEYFLRLNAGSGTVTISCLDYAVKKGFKKIMIFGADFSYINGKTYAAGTYLDSIYLKNAEKNLSFENTFSRLMFRTELIPLDEKSKTTKILDAYKNSFYSYVSAKGLKISNENFVYYIENSSSAHFPEGIFDYKNYRETLLSDVKKLENTEKITPELLQEPLIISVFPYIAFEKEKNGRDFITSLKLALKDIKRYT